MTHVGYAFQLCWTLIICFTLTNLEPVQQPEFEKNLIDSSQILCIVTL